MQIKGTTSLSGPATTQVPGEQGSDTQPGVSVSQETPSSSKPPDPRIRREKPVIEQWLRDRQPGHEGAIDPALPYMLNGIVDGFLGPLSLPIAQRMSGVQPPSVLPAGPRRVDSLLKEGWEPRSGLEHVSPATQVWAIDEKGQEAKAGTVLRSGTYPVLHLREPMQQARPSRPSPDGPGHYWDVPPFGFAKVLVPDPAAQALELSQEEVLALPEGTCLSLLEQPHFGRSERQVPVVLAGCWRHQDGIRLSVLARPEHFEGSWMEGTWIAQTWKNQHFEALPGQVWRMEDPHSRAAGEWREYELQLQKGSQFAVALNPYYESPWGKPQTQPLETKGIDVPAPELGAGLKELWTAALSADTRKQSRLDAGQILKLQPGEKILADVVYGSSSQPHRLPAELLGWENMAEDGAGGDGIFRLDHPSDEPSKLRLRLDPLMVKGQPWPLVYPIPLTGTETGRRAQEPQPMEVSGVSRTGGETQLIGKKRRRADRS